MKSNRNPEDPSSNRKGGMPFWEKMQSKKKAVPTAKKKNFDENQPPASAVRKSMATGEKGWDQVAQWYDQLVGDHGSDYHKNLIMPAVMARLPQLKGARMIDICCGQGFAGKLLRQAGATLVHGVDASPRLIDAARKRAVADNGLSYEVADACVPGAWATGSYDVALNIMAVHDVPDLPGLCKNIARSLQKSGRAILVFMHPCFRIPKQSHWGWDADKKIQFRRIDRYGSAVEIPITTHPGRATGESTVFYHRPLSAYVAALSEAGLAVTGCDELCSHRRSQEGPRSKAEHFAAAEFPLFLLLEACVVGKVGDAVL